MKNQQNPPVPLTIFNIEEVMEPYEKQYMESITAFKAEVIRILNEDLNLVLPIQGSLANIKPYEKRCPDFKDCVEFMIVHSNLSYALNFIVNKKGNVFPELNVPRKEKSSDVYPSWHSSIFWKTDDERENTELCKRLLGWHSAQEIYILLPEIVSFLFPKREQVA